MVKYIYTVNLYVFNYM